MKLDEIKEKYSMMDILNRLNVPVKKGMCNCMLHAGDHTASLKVYPKSFYCFGCGKGGDIITFVEEYNHMNFQEACEWISGEKLTAQGRRALSVAQIKREAQEAKKKKIKQQLSEMEIAIDWGLMQITEPLSDIWCEAYNRWQLNVYKQEELMKELGEL